MDLIKVAEREVESIEKLLSTEALALGTSLFELVKDQYLGGGTADFLYEHQLFDRVATLQRLMGEVKAAASLRSLIKQQHHKNTHP